MVVVGATSAVYIVSQQCQARSRERTHWRKPTRDDMPMNNGFALARVRWCFRNGCPAQLPNSRCCTGAPKSTPKMPESKIQKLPYRIIESFKHAADVLQLAVIRLEREGHRRPSDVNRGHGLQGGVGRLKPLFPSNVGPAGFSRARCSRSANAANAAN